MLMALAAASYAQGDSVFRVDRMIAAIETDSTLRVKEIETAAVFEQDYHDGGTLRLYSDSSGVRKLRIEGFKSYGRYTFTAYLNSGKIVCWVESEEYFPGGEKGEMDRTQLEPGYKEKVYVFNLRMEEVILVEEGQQRFDDDWCSTLEWIPFIEALEKIAREY